MDQLKSVFDYFHPKLESFGTLVVAGGAVRDSLMGRKPKDYDLFVLQAKETWDFSAAKKEMLPALSGVATSLPVISGHNSEPYLVANLDLLGIPVQILVSPVASMQALVATFDWNVCLFAFDGKNYLMGEKTDNIGPGKNLWLNQVTFPLSTLRRGIRFSERFGMKLCHSDVARLTRAMYDKQKKD